MWGDADLGIEESGLLIELLIILDSRIDGLE
jgi:hypothetical protein